MYYCNERKMATMFPYENNDENIPTNTEAYYEAVASQEEIYLEEVEEELRAILIFGDQLPHEQRQRDCCPTQIPK
jgi:hypothetical protein